MITDLLVTGLIADILVTRLTLMWGDCWRFSGEANHKSFSDRANQWPFYAVQHRNNTVSLLVWSENLCHPQPCFDMLLTLTTTLNVVLLYPFFKILLNVLIDVTGTQTVHVRMLSVMAVYHFQVEIFYCVCELTCIIHHLIKLYIDLQMITIYNLKFGIFYKL